MPKAPLSDLATPADKPHRAVSVVRDGNGYRIVYWPSGTPGVGRRLRPRAGTDLAAARERAADLAAGIDAGTVTGRSEEPLWKMAEAWVEDMKETEVPEGTWKTHVSRLDTWVLGSVGNVPSGRLVMEHWRRPVRAVARAGSASATVEGVSSTMVGLISWGRENGWLPELFAPFGSRDVRREELAKFKKDAARIRGARKLVAGKRVRKQPATDPKWAAKLEAANAQKSFPQDILPTWDDVVVLGDAMEYALPGWGRNLVLIIAGSGARLGEALALKIDDYDKDENELAIHLQLDRYNDWPATKLPKGGKIRDSILWARVHPAWDDAASRAHKDGWLFPCDSDRHPKFLAWVGKVFELVIATIGWRWPGAHWLRHHFGSYSLNSRESGGFALDLADVQTWLGHASSDTTLRYYLHAAAGGRKRALALTV